jgi:hypothetical protein
VILYLDGSRNELAASSRNPVNGTTAERFPVSALKLAPDDQASLRSRITPAIIIFSMNF